MTLFGKEIMSPYFNLIGNMENSKFRKPFQQCPHHTKSIFLGFFRTMQQGTRKTFRPVYILLPSVILRHILNYQHYAHTSCWNTERILMSVRHDFMNFTEIGRYKINDDAGCHFRHFLSSRLIN